MHHAEQITNGPIGVGTRFHAETASMGRPVDMVIEITGPAQPLVDHEHVLDEPARHAPFEPVPEGTRMEWSWDLQPGGVLKLLSPLIATIGRRQEQSIWNGLRRHLEAHPN